MIQNLIVHYTARGQGGGGVGVILLCFCTFNNFLLIFF